MTRTKPTSLLDRAILSRAAVDAFAKLAPGAHDEEPGHVHRRGRRARDDALPAARPLPEGPLRIPAPDRLLALGDGPLRELRRGRGRGPRQGAGRRAPPRPHRRPSPGGSSETGKAQREERVPSTQLRKGDRVVVEANEMIPGDGTVVEGIASVNESAITGESAPVIREAGGDRSAVTGGTTVLSDRIVVEITSEQGQTFLDRMIRLVEGAERQKTPNEIALDILLAGPDDRLPLRDRDAAPVRDLLGRERLGHGPHRAPRLPHPDDDRRPPLGHRHRRDGPRPQAQHPRDVGPRRRGGGRRERPPPRQDRARSRSATAKP